MDVDGRYRGLDHNIHTSEGFTNYTIFSLWDTYRAEHPFLNLLKPRQNTDMVQSMIRHQQQSVHGMLPVWSLMGNEGWCMSGYHAVSALADAVAKGADISVGEALMAMDHTANVPYYEGVEAYKRLGYVPFDQSGTLLPLHWNMPMTIGLFTGRLCWRETTSWPIFIRKGRIITGMFSTLRLVLPVPVIATESSGRNLMQCRLTGKDL